MTTYDTDPHGRTPTHFSAVVAVELRLSRSIDIAGLRNTHHNVIVIASRSSTLAVSAVL